MKMKKLTALLLATLMVLFLAACGAKGDSKADNGGETATTEEAAATYKSLMDRENEILSENTDLWEKVFLEADKGMAMIEDGLGVSILPALILRRCQFNVAIRPLEGRPHRQINAIYRTADVSLAAARFLEYL